ncbi:MAG: hypothetical protein ACRD2A_05610 [Vicinamibacterales bacterium]
MMMSNTEDQRIAEAARHVALVFAHTGWAWGGWENPEYTPDAADIALAFHRLLDQCRIHVVTDECLDKDDMWMSSGRLRVSLSRDESRTDGKADVVLLLEVKRWVTEKHGFKSISSKGKVEHA